MYENQSPNSILTPKTPCVPFLRRETEKVVWVLSFSHLRIRINRCKPPPPPRTIFHWCQNYLLGPPGCETKVSSKNLKKMVWAMWKCMVSMPTHSGFENGVYLQKVSFHVYSYSWICKWNIIHIGPLDEWSCKIVPLIISKHATMTILGWNQPIYIFNDFRYFLAFFMNSQIMQIWLLVFLTMECKTYVLAFI